MQRTELIFKILKVVLFTVMILPACAGENMPPETVPDPDDEVPGKVLFRNGDLYFDISPEIPGTGIMFADMQSLEESMGEKRGAHLGHAMVEYADGCILAFHANCMGSASNGGHSGSGWMQYRRSTDGGNTWTESTDLPYSRNVYEDSDHTIACACEKAIVTDEGKIILFFWVYPNTDQGGGWNGAYPPVMISSEDGGETWSDEVNFSSERGRIWDVIKYQGKIYAMYSKYAHAAGNKTTGHWVYISEDDGETFIPLAELPFRYDYTEQYGTFEFLEDGRMIAYIYHDDDEVYAEYSISEDMGKTWHTSQLTRFAKKLRNPQMARLENSYFMFGRSGEYGEDAGHFVVYCSKDGITWDEGHYICYKRNGAGAYSNTLIVGSYNSGTPNRLLVQSSHAYYLAYTNVLMWWIDVYNIE